MLYFLSEEDTMTQALHLQTLYFPQRLLNDLENIHKYTLTVLEAPSGFGKTTALDKFFSDERFQSDGIHVTKYTFIPIILPITGINSATFSKALTRFQHRL